MKLTNRRTAQTLHVPSRKILGRDGGEFCPAFELTAYEH